MNKFHFKHIKKSFCKHHPYFAKTKYIKWAEDGVRCKEWHAKWDESPAILKHPGVWFPLESKCISPLNCHCIFWVIDHCFYGAFFPTLDRTTQNYTSQVCKVTAWNRNCWGMKLMLQTLNNKNASIHLSLSWQTFKQKTTMPYFSKS